MLIHVKNFTSPDDADSAVGIRKAISEAIRMEAEGILLENGIYHLESAIRIETQGMKHDADSKNALNEKGVHIALLDVHDFIIKGALGENGEPATVLAGKNDLVQNNFLPSILWCEKGSNIRLENIAFTRLPEYSSSGKVIDIENDKIIVSVTEGNTFADQMGTFCLNRFDANRNLLGESLSYGMGLGKSWKREEEGVLSLEDRKIASQVAVGDFLSWHQGARTDFQVYFGHINHLLLKKVRTINANGFAMLAESCKNIWADEVSFRPEKRNLFTAPRDAWKLFKCTGSILIRNMYVEGVRMDGQNIHSNWLTVRECIPKKKKIVAFCKYTAKEIVSGSKLEIYNGTEKEVFLIKEGCILREERDGFLYEIYLENELPDFLEEGELCALECWEVEKYVIRDSEFRNVAGAGNLVRADHVEIEGCKYKNIMNHGVLLGAELPCHQEGGHATDILIKDCEFDNCGFVPRYPSSEAACIGIDSSGFSGAYNENISIFDNIFRHSGVGVYVRDARKVILMGNQYYDVNRKFVQDDETVEDIVIWDV